MSRVVSKILMGAALASMVLVGADSAFARGGGGGGGGGGRGGGGGGRSFSGGGGRSFSGGGGRSFGAPAARSFSGSNWSGRSWNGGNWNGNRNWSGNWNRGWNGRGWDGRGNWRWNGSSWVWGIAPLIGWGWGDGYYGYGYPYYNYGYSYPYSYDNGYSSYDYYSQPTYNYGYSQPAYSSSYNSSMPTNPPDSLSRSVSVFQSGNYKEAERLARHTVVDEPNNAQAHLLLSLTAFANVDFRTAADEARKAVSLGEIPNWSQIYAMYGNLDRYTSNLRALENSVKQNPRDPDAQFLLGFMYLANGYRSDAQEHLAMAHEAMPDDRIVGELLSQAGGQVPTTAARPNAPQSFEGSNAPTNVGPSNAPMNVPQGNRSENIGPSTNVPMNIQPNHAGTGASAGSTGGQNFNQPPAPPTEDRGAASRNSSSGPPAGEPPAAPTGSSSGRGSY